MSSRKKRRPTLAPSKPKEHDGFGTFGDLLGRPSPAGKAGTIEKPAPVAPAPPPPPPPRAATRRVTADELMAAAFAAAGDADPWAAKYRGDGYDAGDVELAGDEPAATLGAADLALELDPEALLFESAFGGAVTPMRDRDRYAALDDHEWVGVRWRDEHELATLSAEALMEPELTAAQRRLLRQSRGSTVPTLNIRGETRGEALGEVEAFVRAQRADGSAWARVITGKGKRSVGAPVLKPAVIAWCDGEGAALVRGWAPETDRSGNYGSVLLWLRADVAR